MLPFLSKKLGLKWDSCLLPWPLQVRVQISAWVTSVDEFGGFLTTKETADQHVHARDWAKNSGAGWRALLWDDCRAQDRGLLEELPGCLWGSPLIFLSSRFINNVMRQDGRPSVSWTPRVTKAKGWRSHFLLEGPTIERSCHETAFPASPCLVPGWPCRPAKKEIAIHS
ncbi:hypothetical protein KIL84_002559 [Mauremys mutica]|uniref:Uncharacterized protein n=1 Tax=Mauremys mutica TaxID=74926 RepID=A0A9D3X836_9SAUR|nr:hypothetical protein KIL84_002559 [Mauremys mutica]